MISGTDTFSNGFYYQMLCFVLLEAALSVSVDDKEQKTRIFVCIDRIGRRRVRLNDKRFLLSVTEHDSRGL
jgi:hypothetical protein